MLWYQNLKESRHILSLWRLGDSLVCKCIVTISSSQTQYVKSNKQQLIQILRELKLDFVFVTCSPRNQVNRNGQIMRLNK